MQEVEEHKMLKITTHGNTTNASALHLSLYCVAALTLKTLWKSLQISHFGLQMCNHQQILKVISRSIVCRCLTFDRFWPCGLTKQKKTLFSDFITLTVDIHTFSESNENFYHISNCYAISLFFCARFDKIKRWLDRWMDG